MTRGQESLTIDLGAALPQLGVGRRGRCRGGRRPPGAARRRARDRRGTRARTSAYLAALDRESNGRCLWLALTREPDAAAIAAA